LSKGISVVMPALNEAGNLAGAVEAVNRAAAKTDVDAEIILVDDGSTDGTGELADRLARERPGTRVVHHPVPRGLGYSYREGVGLAGKEFVVMLPGDDEIEAESVERMFSLAGTADMVIPYTENPGVRPPARRVVSAAFTRIMNALSGMKLRYYNGPVVHRRALLASVPMRTDGFAYQAEIITRLARGGASRVETGMRLKERAHGSSKAFKLRNVLSVAGTLARLAALSLRRKR